MYKQVKVKNLFYEMILEVSKKQRKKPEEVIEILIKGAYDG